MKGPLKRPTERGRIRLGWAKPKGRFEDRGCEIVARHEGLAPVRLSIGLETGSAHPSGRILAAHRIDRPVFFACVLGPLARGRHGSLFHATRLRGRHGQTERVQPSAITKRRQPFTCSKNGGTGTQTEGTRQGERARPTPSRHLTPESGSKAKNVAGVGVSH